MERLRILLADDHDAVRRAIRSLLESQPQWDVCCEARTGREAVEQARLQQPDIVLLDISMPELNGLEAARQILGQRPGTRILFLTIHQSDQLTEEARRVGAEGVVLKSNAQMLTPAIHALCRRTTGVHLAGSGLNHSRHVAAFLGSGEERYQILYPFIAEGLMRGEKAFHIIDSLDHETHVRRLMNAGVDVDRAAAQHQMEIVHWDAMYLQGGHFDPQATLTRVVEVLRNSAAQGFPMARAIANMEWALVPPPSVEVLVEYESRLNGLLAAFDDVVVCTYDLAKFDAAVIIDVMRAHSAVVIGESLHQEPFHLSPEQMLHELGSKTP